MIRHYDILIKKGDETPIKCEVITKSSDQFSLKFISNELGEYEWQGIDILDCFNQMRLYVESKEFIILVNGTVKNTWASGGLRDSSNGELTYLIDDKSEHKILNIFDFCDINNVKYDVHLKYHKNWLKQRK